ncbi:hypothetical protein SAMN05428978_105413 [Nitrosomonas sp. Nm34]|nr:hypothetical protein SAMN05428978_105413 [Nitrosomonas sp. Nm34]
MAINKVGMEITKSINSFNCYSVKLTYKRTVSS